ncbi:MAG TPA: ion channel [Candidatus Krumholzibacterium sp.]|nr:ion channel [Candidatus Krumholzibacterium sp.]
MESVISYLRSGTNKFRHLTVAMALWFILFPVFQQIPFGYIYLNVLTSAIMLFGIFAVNRSKKAVATGLSLGLPWFILSWIDILVTSLPGPLMMVTNLFLALFLGFTAVSILSYIVRATEISRDLLFGAACIYVLIGGTWATIFMVLQTVQPGSIMNVVTGTVNLSDLVYFSFSTLTTLGYGDLIPVSTTARSLAIIEAVAGVLYIAIIISRLVGIFIANTWKK